MLEEMYMVSDHRKKKSMGNDEKMNTYLATKILKRNGYIHFKSITELYG